MAGHSKWATIRRKKEKIDAARGKVFTKLGREIMVAAREGGGANPDTNTRLKEAITRAKAANMPNDNIKRLIDRAAGAADGANYEEVQYEGYGPSGVAVIVQAVTDNRNRTSSEVRYAFDRSGGSLGTTGCVSWMFERKGVIIIEEPGDFDEDTLLLLALDAGADDVQSDEGIYEITCEAAQLAAVRDALSDAGVSIASAEAQMVPTNTIAVEGDDAEKVVRLVDVLEDNDDIQDVFHNADIPEEYL